MEENKNYELEDLQEQEEQSALDFQTIYSTLILNWNGSFSRLFSAVPLQWLT